jgi:hypothetical protein
MKRKKRLLFSLLSMLCLVSCGGNEGNKENPSVNPPSGQTDVNEDPFKVIPQDSWNIDDSGKIKYVRINSTAAGLNAATDTSQYGAGGTDLGFPWYDEEAKRLYVTFGDSFVQHKMGGEWNSNVTLYTNNFDFTKGVKWEGALNGSFGATRQITPVTQNVANRNGWTASSSDICSPLTSTTIPTGGIVVNGTYYLFYMEVYKFNQVHESPGITRNGMWDTFNSRVVKSTDKGKTWTLCDKLVWQCHDSEFNCLNGEPFAQIHPLDIGDDYIYIYGIKGGRESGVSMARVLKTKIEDFNEYEYFCGINKTTKEPTYRKGEQGLAYIKGKSNCLVISGKCGELSLSYNPYFKKYMIFYLSSQSQIVYRLMNNPYDFGAPVSIAGQGNIPFLYGGATHEVMFDNNGQRMFMFIAQWSDKIYSTHLVEVVFNKK